MTTADAGCKPALPERNLPAWQFTSPFIRACCRWIQAPESGVRGRLLAGMTADRPLARNSASHLQQRQKRLLRYLHLPDPFHALLAFFLSFQQFALAGHVAAVALGERRFSRAVRRGRRSRTCPFSASWLATGARRSRRAGASPYAAGTACRSHHAHRCIRRRSAWRAERTPCT